MKKTLLLMALLGSTAFSTLKAESTVIWSAGINPDDKSTYYTSYKHNPSYGWDHNMCWAASASNVIAWWQDQVTISGAYILPQDCPTGYDVWEKVRLMWQDNAGYAVRVMQHWLSGDRSGTNDPKFTEEGLAFKGYFPHLLGTHYPFNGSARPDNCMTTSVYANAKIAENTYDVAVPQIIDLMKDGWGLVLGSENHAMTIYGIEVTDGNQITKVWYNDNNHPYNGEGYMETSTVRKGGENNYGFNGIMADQLGYGGDIEIVYAMRSTGMQFDTYEAVAGEGNTADLFSHFLNLTVDGASDYKLQYDLRNAMADGSPVDARNAQDEKISTGDIILQDGKLSLVAGVDKYDGGGKSSGTIAFKEEDGATRTLSVQHTATIAKEIKIAAAENNTLEVTQGNTATFGKLTGTGDLDKTGMGSAEVTDEVSLVGAIRVHEGAFILGADVALTEKTQLTVLGGGSVQGKAGEDIVLSFTGGVHENNGVMSLATTVKDGAVLKGSGTFGDVAVQDGGKLVVGNSPGKQTYTGNLSVNMGEIVFGVSGWDTPADADNVGWGSGAYSNIVMNGGSLTLGNGSTLEFALGGGAMATLLANPSTAFNLTIATGFGNGDEFTSELLKQLAQQTIFTFSTEDGAFTDARSEFKDGETLNTHITNLEYKLEDNTTLCVTGVYWAAESVVPEPATGTLGLLALCALASRRRRN